MTLEPERVPGEVQRGEGRVGLEGEAERGTSVVTAHTTQRHDHVENPTHWQIHADGQRFSRSLVNSFAN